LRKKKGVEKTQRCINLSLFELEIIFQHQLARVIWRADAIFQNGNCNFD
jgi:hypothetical protein